MKTFVSVKSCIPMGQKWYMHFTCLKLMTTDVSKGAADGFPTSEVVSPDVGNLLGDIVGADKLLTP